MVLCMASPFWPYLQVDGTSRLQGKVLHEVLPHLRALLGEVDLAPGLPEHLILGRGPKVSLSYGSLYDSFFIFIRFHIRATLKRTQPSPGGMSLSGATCRIAWKMPSKASGGGCKTSLALLFRLSAMRSSARSPSSKLLRSSSLSFRASALFSRKGP